MDIAMTVIMVLAAIAVFLNLVVISFALDAMRMLLELRGELGGCRDDITNLWRV